jgi:hypothetical protein
MDFKNLDEKSKVQDDCVKCLLLAKRNLGLGERNP